jgi:hypothetical protein
MPTADGHGKGADGSDMHGGYMGKRRKTLQSQPGRPPQSSHPFANQMIINGYFSVAQAVL